MQGRYLHCHFEQGQRQIAQTLRDVLKAHPPEVCVVEGLFYAQNFQTALIMGAARGAALVAWLEQGSSIG